MGSDTVLVTGSNGALGRATVAELTDAGYDVVGFDREPPGVDGVTTHRTGELLDADAVAEAVRAADAVVHLGTLADPESQPGHETYRHDATAAYNVLAAADEYGVDRVALASSIDVGGGVDRDAPTEVRYLPVDEDHPVTPRGPDARGELTVAVQAGWFARRAGAPRRIATLRFPWVATAATLSERLVHGDRTLDGLDDSADAGQDDLFAYVARTDAARALRRALEADFAGHETFNVAAADTTMETPTPELVERCYPGVPAKGLSGHDALVDCGKAARVLGWEPAVTWRDLVERDDRGVAAEWRAARRKSRVDGIPGLAGRAARTFRPG